MDISEPLVLYSTNAWLAYQIARRYYGDIHHVCCSPFFDPRCISIYDSTNPPSSSPCEIFWDLFEASHRGDLNNPKIKELKVRIVYGANEKLRNGVINKKEEAAILWMVDKAQSLDFRPLIYVIPYGNISTVAKAVQLEEIPVEKKGHPLSSEYIIRALPRKLFDVIAYERWR